MERVLIRLLWSGLCKSIWVMREYFGRWILVSVIGVRRISVTIRLERLLLMLRCPFRDRQETSCLEIERSD